MDCPIFFAHIKPLSRAKYEIKFELITDTPNQYHEGEITRLHSQILEKILIEIQPHYVVT